LPSAEISYVLTDAINPVRLRSRLQRLVFDRAACQRIIDFDIGNTRAAQAVDIRLRSEFEAGAPERVAEK
jgi:hypothetical protein